jgi:hypothetical protein
LRNHLSQRHKGIHLILEVNTLFGNSTPTTVPARNLALGSLDFPLIAAIGITGRERRKNLPTKSYKAKLKRLR